MNNSIGQGLKGSARKKLMQLHRLSEFGLAFDRYLRGECSAGTVKLRAEKMLAIGLPGDLKLK